MYDIIQGNGFFSVKTTQRRRDHHRHRVWCLKYFRIVCIIQRGTGEKKKKEKQKNQNEYKKQKRGFQSRCTMVVWERQYRKPQKENLYFSLFLLHHFCSLGFYFIRLCVRVHTLDEKEKEKEKKKGSHEICTPN